MDAAGTTLLALTDRVVALVMSRRFAQQFFPLATARLRPTAVLGALLLSAGLGSLGVLSLTTPRLASSTYGLPAGGVADAWVSATGLRDLGLAVSMLVLLRHAPDAISYTCGACWSFRLGTPPSYFTMEVVRGWRFLIWWVSWRWPPCCSRACTLVHTNHCEGHDLTSIVAGPACGATRMVVSRA